MPDLFQIVGEHIVASCARQNQSMPPKSLPRIHQISYESRNSELDSHTRKAKIDLTANRSSPTVYLQLFSGVTFPQHVGRGMTGIPPGRAERVIINDTHIEKEISH